MLKQDTNGLEMLKLTKFIDYLDLHVDTLPRWPRSDTVFWIGDNGYVWSDREWHQVYVNPESSELELPVWAVVSANEIKTEHTIYAIAAGMIAGKENDLAVVTQAVADRMRAKAPAHDLYKDGDEDIPDVICDSNGQVVLGLCKVCNRAEVDLEQPCSRSMLAVRRS